MYLVNQETRPEMSIECVTVEHARNLKSRWSGDKQKMPFTAVQVISVVTTSLRMSWHTKN